MQVVYKYYPRRNKRNRSLAGVPLRDLTDVDLASYPEHVLLSIENCRFYEAVTAEPDEVEVEVADDFIDNINDDLDKLIDDLTDSAIDTDEAEGGK